MKGVLETYFVFQIFFIGTIDALNFTVIYGIGNKSSLECNSMVIIRCNADKSSGAMHWKIGKIIDANTAVAADCVGSPCIVHNNFGGRYKFTYNTSAGFADLIISPANLHDHNMSYLCDDYIARDTFKAVVKLFPKNDTTRINTRNLTIQVTTGCTVNAGELIFSWYKRKTNDSNRVLIAVSNGLLESQNCACVSECSGTCFTDTYEVKLKTLGENEAKYNIECEITSTDTDAGDPVTVVSSDTFVAKVNEATPVCDEKLCLTCWIFIILLLSITVPTVVIVVSVNVCCWTADKGRWVHWNMFPTACSVILIAAHIAVTLISRFCRHADSCEDDKCLPCWAYCVILLVIISTSIFVIVIAKVCCEEKMIGCLRIWKISAIAVILLAAIAYVAVILLARFCKVKAYTPETSEINCEIYGIILACIFASQFCVVVVVKVCCPKKMVSKVFFVVGIIILIVIEVVFVILSGYGKKYMEDSKRAVSCWSIFLIVSGATFIFLLLVTLIYIFLEPLQEVKILSRQIDGKLMQAQIQWKCRLVEHKKYFVQLDQNSRKNNATEVSCDIVDKKSGLLKVTLAGLTIDSQYRAYVYTKMYSIPSLVKTVEFDTKGRPLTPTYIREDESLQTESSITLTWKAGSKETNEKYLIKYKRTKAVKAEWILTTEISKTQFTLDELKPGTSYTVILIAKNQIGLSEESKPLVVKTRATLPEPPTDFRCKSINQEDVTVSWKPSRKIKKQKFRLSVSNLTNDEDSSACSEEEIWITYDGSETMEFTVKELEPETEYVFEIISVVGRKASKRSAVLVITTEGYRNELDSYHLGRRDKKTTSVFHLNSKQT